MPSPAQRRRRTARKIYLLEQYLAGAIPLHSVKVTGVSDLSDRGIAAEVARLRSLLQGRALPE